MLHRNSKVERVNFNIVFLYIASQYLALRSNSVFPLSFIPKRSDALSFALRYSEVGKRAGVVSCCDSLALDGSETEDMEC